ncbi:DNA recombination and repair protein RecO [hydrothermal vent metagenome]|uniref:DNA repair protein RecO n=1 Tax=hydrothermal vent metagenome TaxID=652676 RepID=A0A3B0TFN4_9ZZZZ
MQWSGEGVIIGVRRHGETSVIVETMTPDHGRHLGLVRGGRSRRHAATLQVGNSVQLDWRARLSEHLGTFTIELEKARAADLIAARNRLYAAQTVCAHLRLLPERDPNKQLYLYALEILDADAPVCQLAQMVSLLELNLLDQLGFGLDMASCALSGATCGLSHVSPKTGRAVTSEAAAPYLDRLLKLPPYFLKNTMASPGDVLDGLQLTGHFLHMHIWGPRQIDQPPMRDCLIVDLEQQSVGRKSGDRFFGSTTRP